MPSRPLTPREAKKASHRERGPRLGLTAAEARELATLKAIPWSEMTSAQNRRFYQLLGSLGAAERNRAMIANRQAVERATAAARLQEERTEERARWAGVLEEAKRHEAAILAEWGLT